MSDWILEKTALTKKAHPSADWPLHALAQSADAFSLLSHDKLS
jgi:hypothetical protein